jgi:hypothetical protein
MDDSEQEVAVGWWMTGTKIRASFLAHFSSTGALPWLNIRVQLCHYSNCFVKFILLEQL